MLQVVDELADCSCQEDTGAGRGARGPESPEGDLRPCGIGYGVGCNVQDPGWNVHEEAHVMDMKCSSFTG